MSYNGLDLIVNYLKTRDIRLLESKEVPINHYFELYESDLSGNEWYLCPHCKKDVKGFFPVPVADTVLYFAFDIIVGQYFTTGKNFLKLHECTKNMAFLFIDKGRGDCPRIGICARCDKERELIINDNVFLEPYTICQECFDKALSGMRTTL